MTTPYYEDDQVTLYHGDCREITEWLEADVLVTDPPYGMNFQSGHRRETFAKIAGDDDTAVRDAVAAMWGPDRPALMFGRWSVPAPAGERQRSSGTRHPRPAWVTSPSRGDRTSRTFTSSAGDGTGRPPGFPASARSSPPPRAEGGV